MQAGTSAEPKSHRNHRIPAGSQFQKTFREIPAGIFTEIPQMPESMNESVFKIGVGQKNATGYIFLKKKINFMRSEKE